MLNSSLEADLLGSKMQALTGADPEFLERGFICMKVWGLADFL